MKYTQQFDGDIVTPKMRGYRIMCCQCGAVHVFDFFVKHHGRGHQVSFRVRKDYRASRRMRRG